MSKLDQLNQALNDHLNQQTRELDLLAALTSTNPIAQFLASIAANQLFVIDGAAIDFPPPGSQITVTGTSSAVRFVNAAINLFFTLNEQGVLVADLTVIGQDEWRFEALPWIGLSQPRIEIRAYDTLSMPVVGAIGMTTNLGSLPVVLRSRFPSFSDGWLFVAEPPPDTINIANLLQYIGGVNLPQMLPPGLNVVASLSVQQVTFDLDPSSQTLYSIQATIGSTRDWPLFGNIHVTRPTIRVAIAHPADLKNRAVTYSVSGQIELDLGGGQDPGIIDVQVAYPNLSLQASLDQASPPIPLGAFLQSFAPGTEFDLHANLASFMMGLQFQRGVSYDIAAGIATDWPVEIGGERIFTITGLAFNVEGQGSGTPSGSVSGTVAIGPDENPLHVTVTARYEDDASGWVFEGETQESIKLGQLAKKYLGIDIDQDYGIAGIRVSIALKTGAWSIAGSTAEEWQLPFTPDAGIRAAVAISHDADGYAGTLTGSVRYQAIEIDLSYDIKQGAFTLTWDAFTASLKDKVADFRLKGVTLGGMIERSVTWATGTPFGLAAPWDLLDDLPLDDIHLTFDFKTNKVSFGLDIRNLDFGFAKLERINVAYESPKVNVELVGSFIWQQGPLTWDAADPASTPAPPGGGSKYFDLRLLALGQHVAIKGQHPFISVEQAIEELRKLPDTPPVSTPGAPTALLPGAAALLPTAGAASTPTAPADGTQAIAAEPQLLPAVGEDLEIVYDANAGWLVATDFGILRVDPPKQEGTAPTPGTEYFLSLSIIFNDPNLYALRAALAGPAAKVLSGLAFEIMYQRVTDTVGVYQAEVTLPPAMRSIDVGAYSITLPVFAIAVYTNGDFKVDVGFPWNMDFARSLTVQGIVYPGIPVIGSVGLYFGKLSSATSTQVPRSTKGTFNPVIIFGLGMRVGVGKEIEKGPLKAGFSITVFGIIEGVIARWNPNVPATTGGRQIQDSYYFWLQGTLGILGKLYGSVDFAVVKADVDLTVRLAAQITFESYRDIPITVQAAVDIKVKITIDVGLFTIKISFSFSATIKETFTIKNAGRAPWDSDALLADGPASRRRMRLRAAREAALLSAPQELVMTWTNLRSAQDPVSLSTYLVPALTVHGDGASTLATQQAAYVLLLAMESVPQLTEGAAEAEADTAFEQLCQQVLRWVVAASLTRGEYTADQIDEMQVTDDTLASIMEYLANKHPKPDSPWTPVPVKAIADFMAGQFVVDLSAPPPDNGGKSIEKDTTLFPMVPDLQLTVPDPHDPQKPPLLQYQFSAFNSLSSSYLNKMATYFDELAVQVQQEVQQRPTRMMAGPDQAQPSMATFIFADYFLLLARQMVQAARDGLRDYRYPIDPAQTAAEIVEWVEQEAGVPYEVFDLFESNLRHRLSDQKQLWIPGLQYQVRSGDTLTSIAKGGFGGAFTVADLAAQGGNPANPSLLMPGQRVTYSPPGGGDSVERMIQRGDTLDSLVAFFGATDLKGLLAHSDLATQPVLHPLAVLEVPTFAYTTAAGDTLTSVMQRLGVTLQSLAGESRNAQIAGLFDAGSDSYLDIAHLTQQKVKWLLAEIKQSHGLRRLSGMASRFFLHGLRLPTEGITPQQACMCDQSTPRGRALAPECGLYTLTGQQFPIPALADTDTFTFSLDNPAGTKWVKLGGDGKGER